MCDEPTGTDESLRGRSIEMFAQLERSLDSVIANYYAPRHPLSTYFTIDLLSSESFSYGLRRDVFESIVRRHDWYDGKRMQHLFRAGRWRNFLVHVAGMETHVYEGDDDMPKKVGFRDPKRPNDTLTVQEAFDRFKPECEEAVAYVNEVNHKVVPMDRFMRPGHVVESPIAPGETYEDWINRPMFDEES